LTARLERTHLACGAQASCLFFGVRRLDAALDFLAFIKPKA
jgi:hypothetical protein